MKKIFIRVDDIGQDTDKFLIFLDIVRKENLPATYAVIPGLLDEKLTGILKEEISRGCSVIQHGLFHQNHNSSEQKHEKYEFGNNRSFEQQFQDIIKGKKYMNQYFENNFTQIFVPPWHMFNIYTLKALKKANFNFISLSKSDEKIKHDNFKYLSVDVVADIHLDNFEKFLVKKINHHIFAQEVTGILFHHNQLKTSAEIKRFKFLLFIIKELAKRYNAKFINMNDLLYFNENIERKNKQETDSELIGEEKI